MPRSSRITDTFDRPSRGPIVFVLVASTIMGALVACNVKDEARSNDSAMAAAAGSVASQPDDSTQPTIENGAPPSVVPENVTFAEAESTYKERHYGEATQMFAAYVQRRPDNPWGQYMLGLSAWKAGDLEAAVGAFERSIELDPTHVKSYLNLGRVLLDQERASDALERVTAAAEIDPTSAEVHRMMGRVRTALGQPDSALVSYRTALSFDGGDVWSMNNMALILIQQERYEEALPPLARAVQLRADAPVFQNNLGIALERTGRVTLAAQSYRAALAADSTYRKASLSLTRVDGRLDDPLVPPVELEVLAQTFERDVEGWKAERTIPVGTTAVKPDSTTVPK